MLVLYMCACSLVCADLARRVASLPLLLLPLYHPPLLGLHLTFAPPPPCNRLHPLPPLMMVHPVVEACKHVLASRCRRICSPPSITCPTQLVGVAVVVVVVVVELHGRRRARMMMCQCWIISCPPSHPAYDSSAYQDRCQQSHRSRRDWNNPSIGTSPARCKSCLRL